MAINKNPTTAEEQFELAMKYYNGDGLKQDYAEAVKWLKKAAEQGLVEAQFNLGICYLSGTGINQDTKKPCIGLEK